MSKGRRGLIWLGSLALGTVGVVLFAAVDVVDSAATADLAVDYNPSILAGTDADGQPLYVLSGDGRMYRNRPAPAPAAGSMRPVDVALGSVATNLAHNPHSEPTWRSMACPDGIAVRDQDGIEVCAVACHGPADCPPGNECRLDLSADGSQGVCLP